MANKAKEMFNVKMSVAKGKLKMEIDLNDFLNKAELSDSKKSYIIASTRGNQNLTAKGYEDIKVGLNVFIPRKRFEELQRIAELEKTGGRVVKDLPQDDKDKRIAELEAQLEQQNALLQEILKKLNK